MDRYLKSDDVLKTLRHLLYETALNQFDFDVSDVYEDIAKNRLETWVDLIPTAEVVEVVRCKDCKHYRDSFPYDTCDGFDAKATDEEDFCSYGERKGGRGWQ